MSAHCVVVTDPVILAFNDGTSFFAVLEATGSVRLKMGSIPTRALVGARYGSLWELQGKGVVQLAEEDAAADAGAPSGDSAEDDAEEEEEEAGEREAGASAGEGASSAPSLPARASAADNRALVDTNSAQTLAASAIASMKQSGVEGGAIVESLVAHSATFAGKTAFSQEKYVRKKTAKHVHRFRLTRATADAALGILHTYTPDKVGWLRGDSLGQMLAAADVRAGRRVLTVDGWGGIVSGAVLERMLVDEELGSGAALLCAHADRFQHPAYHLSDKLHVGAALRRVGVPIKYSELAAWPAAKPSAYPVEESSEAAGAGAGAGVGTGKRKRAEESSPAPSLKAARSAHSRRSLLSSGVDSLLVAVPGDPEAAVLAALRYARPSASFAVFSVDVVVLASLSRRLHTLGLGIAMQLGETWSREYQVLPERTHPAMSMDGLSGFLLTGTATDHAWRVQLPAPTDVDRMRLACTLAESCVPVASAYNVGAVLVAPDGAVRATGFSRELPGNTHAEEVCLAKAGEGGARGCTIFTTMEPCSTRLSGKAACADTLQAAGVVRVVLSVPEPPHFVADCTGAAQLRRAGLVVDTVDDAECRARALGCNRHIGQGGGTASGGQGPPAA
jgi:tRNA (adenine-N(1)-)-methyltransferase non-catalytic subunit